MQKYTLYWLTGQREVVEGNTPEEAFTKAGYGAGATRALDFYANGEDNSYAWNPVDRTWQKKIEVL